MVLIIDYYDSFTYNLAQYIGELGENVIVKRSDNITLQELVERNPKYLIISSGPAKYNDAVDVGHKAIRFFAGKIPILGVSLGHQKVVKAFGGDITEAKELIHGKAIPVYHDEKRIFHGLMNPFDAGCYHSLTVREEALPNCFEVTARTATDEIMAIRHREFAIEGVQFHPESSLTVAGKQLLKNFITCYRM